MSASKTLGLLLVVTGLLWLPGCGDDDKLQDIGEKAKATWKAVAAYTVEQKDKALTFFGARMDDLKDQWQKAKEKSAGWSADAKAALDEKWADVQSAYAKTKDATGEGKARDAFVELWKTFRLRTDPSRLISPPSPAVSRSDRRPPSRPRAW